MPVKRRSPKHKTLPEPMPWEPATAEQWHAHREKMLAESSAGKRPWAWWQHESPEPRDPKIDESLQLYKLGLLTQAELEALKPFWCETEKKARGGLPFTRGPGDTLEGRAAYLAWRAWAGIPSDLFPPQRTLERIFKIKSTKGKC